MIDEWDLTATNLSRTARRKYEVAVIPTGAIEPHNRHLPQGQDYRHTGYLARRCCEAAWPRCESVLCLPPLPYGVDCNLMAFPLAITVSQATLDAMLREIIASLRHHSIRKIVLLNGHGGNNFGPLIRQLQCDTDVHVFCCNWWTVGHDRYDEIFDAPDDHAGEMETSIAMHLYPELVEFDTAGSGLAKPYRFEALEKGWVHTSRDFAKLNDHCAVGDPSKASADKGEKYLDLVAGRITDFLVALAAEPIDDNFPMAP